MPLATRELELIIIARDHTSAALARIGGAMTILGGAIARVGAAGVSELAKMTQESIEFRRQIALAFTQAEIEGLQFNDVLNMVRDSARRTAVPIEELTGATFDIFSTIDLDSVDQAQGLLDAFARSAVAGQAPVENIGRATLAWLNALDLAPTVENANRILDTQFELVRKGAGTYEEFAGEIGKAIPAFVAANQEVEEFSGTLAFLTREGLNPAMAATSAARAIELLYSPKAIAGLEKLGITTIGATGEFRKMDDLLADVVKQFEGLDSAERKIAFKEIFGQGRIQARRFFDLILNEGGFEGFLTLLEDVRQSAGGVNEAFDIMTQEPAVQLEFLRNQFMILRQEIGDQFIPLLTERLIPAMSILLDWWFELDDLQKQNVAQWAGIAAVGVTVAGALAAVVGALTLLFGLFKALGTSAFLSILLTAGLPAILLAIGAAVGLAVVDFEKFKEVTNWDETIVPQFERARDFLRDKFPQAIEAVEDGFKNLRGWFDTEWPLIWAKVQETASNAIVKVKDFLGDVFGGGTTQFLQGIPQQLEDFAVITGRIVNTIRDHWDQFVEYFWTVWESLSPVFETLKSGFTNLWDTITAIGSQAIEVVIAAYNRLETVITWFVENVLPRAQDFWERHGETIMTVLSAVVAFVISIFEWIGNIILGFLQMAEGLLNGDWEQIWEGFTTILNAHWEMLKSIFTTITTWVTGVWTVFTDMLYDLFWGAVDKIMGVVTPWVVDIQAAFSTIGEAWSTLVDTVMGWLENLKTNSARVIDDIVEGFKRLLPWTRSSPSLIEQADTSYAILNSTIGEKLQELLGITSGASNDVRNSLNNLVPDSSDQLRKLASMRDGFMSILRDLQIGGLDNPLSNFGFGSNTSVNEILQAKALQEARAGAGSQTLPVREGPLVNIGTLQSNADPTEIAKEIAWRVVTGGGQ